MVRECLHIFAREDSTQFLLRRMMGCALHRDAGGGCFGPCCPHLHENTHTQRPFSYDFIRDFIHIQIPFLPCFGHPQSPSPLHPPTYIFSFSFFGFSSNVFVILWIVVNWRFGRPCAYCLENDVKICCARCLMPEPMHNGISFNMITLTHVLPSFLLPVTLLLD